MLTDSIKAELQQIGAELRYAEIKNQLLRAHRAINDGTFDRGTANDALDRIDFLCEQALKPTSAPAEDRPLTAAFRPQDHFNPPEPVQQRPPQEQFINREPERPGIEPRPPQSFATPQHQT